MNTRQPITVSMNSLSYSQGQTRFICRLFGNRNHDFIDIDNEDKKFIIHKTMINEYEKRGLVTNWEFELDHIYKEDITPEEIYENEINCSDYLIAFNEGIRRTIIFVGSSEDSFNKEPLATIIRNSMNDFLIIETDKDKTGKPGNSTDYVVSMSWCELSNRKVIDVLMNKQINSKLSYNKDEICIEALTQVEIDTIEKFDSIMNQFDPQNGNDQGNDTSTTTTTTTMTNASKFKLKPKSINSTKPNIYRYSNDTIEEKNKKCAYDQSCHLLSIKYYNTNTNICISKVNFFLYRAYEFNRSQLQLCSPPYHMYTKENYAFFKALNSKLNSRTSNVFKYIEDTYYTGKNICLVNVPIELEYMVLIHDLLNNIKMRKLTCQNFLLNQCDDNEEEDEDDGVNDIGSKVNEMSLTSPSMMFNSSSSNKENEFYCSNSTVNETPLSISFSKINETTSTTNTIHTTANTKPNAMSLNLNLNLNTELNELNIERLKKIKNKGNIIQLFKLMDTLKGNYTHDTTNQ